jgi:two-component system phosphate regulon sensor histidine kinase PhoR
MNRRILTAVIASITCALVGLTVMQLYWIRSASSVREANFRQSVNDAMAKVVFQLERLEKRKAAEISPFGGMLEFNEHLDYSLFISPHQLDSLISRELNIRGIDTRFEFGIYEPEKNRFLLEPTGNSRKQLVRHGYAFQLFTRDLFSSPEYLLIHFPYESRFLLIKLWGMLLISVILIAVIVFSFVYTILLLIRQKKLSELKNDLINNMTHEFRTPISTISLACEALADPEIPRTEAMYASYTEMIREENNRLAILSERILQAAVLEKGQLKLRKEPVDLHRVIRDVVKSIRIQVEIKDGEIRTDLLANPPVVEGDRVHLTNLVYNLLDNANKYTPKKPVIRILTENAGEGITCTVEDNGMGIPRQEQKRIFDRLYRIPAGNIHDVRGFGLGLSYVRAIVDEHRGRISLESEPDKGTRFTVFLPYQIPES